MEEAWWHGVRSVEVDEFVEAEEDAGERLPGFQFQLVGRGFGFAEFGSHGGEELQSAIDFFDCGFPRKSEAVRQLEPRRVVALFSDEPLCKAFGLFMDQRIVEEIERLERRRAGGALRRADGGISAVENSEERMTLDALRHEINAALVRFVRRLERIVLGELPFGLRRKRMWSAGVPIECAAQG